MLEVALEFKNLNRSLAKLQTKTSNTISDAVAAAFSDVANDREFQDAFRSMAEEAVKAAQRMREQSAADFNEAVKNVVDEIADSTEKVAKSMRISSKDIGNIGMLIAESFEAATLGFKNLAENTTLFFKNTRSMETELEYVSERLRQSFEDVNVTIEDGIPLIEATISELDKMPQIIRKWQVAWYDFYLKSGSGVRAVMRGLEAGVKRLGDGIKNIIDTAIGFVGRYGPIAVMLMGFQKAREGLDNLSARLDEIQQRARTLAALTGKNMRVLRQELAAAALDVAKSNIFVDIEQATESILELSKLGYDVTQKHAKELAAVASQFAKYTDSSLKTVTKYIAKIDKLARLQGLRIDFDQLLGSLTVFGDQSEEVLGKIAEFLTTDKWRALRAAGKDIQWLVDQAAGLAKAFQQVGVSQELALKLATGLFEATQTLEDVPVAIKSTVMAIQQGRAEFSDLIREIARLGDRAKQIEILRAIGLPPEDVKIVAANIDKINENMRKMQVTSKRLSTLMGEDITSLSQLFQLIKSRLAIAFESLWINVFDSFTKQFSESSNTTVNILQLISDRIGTIFTKLGKILGERMAGFIKWLQKPEAQERLESMATSIAGFMESVVTGLPRLINMLTKIAQLFMDHPILTTVLGIGGFKLLNLGIDKFKKTIAEKIGKALVETGMSIAIRNGINAFKARFINLLGSALSAIGLRLGPMIQVALVAAAVTAIAKAVVEAKKAFEAKEEAERRAAELKQFEQRKQLELELYNKLKERLRETEINGRKVDQRMINLLEVQAQKSGDSVKYLQDLVGLSDAEFKARIRELDEQRLERAKKRAQEASRYKECGGAGFYYGGQTTVPQGGVR